MPSKSLPIDAALPELRTALAVRNRVVLVAPPGAGKTTRVPLALLQEPWAADRRILILEPRRLAARAAAAHMAALLGEEVGETIGLRVRMESRSGPRTRVEVITEGVFTRMILDDPELSSVAAVLFDEFHERSLDADLGLALACDAQGALREDLRLVVMSATLDGARVSAVLGDAPVIESEGRAFPIETRHLPRRPDVRVEAAMDDAVRTALRAESGSVLVFLPGQAEIRRAGERLSDLAATGVDVLQLHGGLDLKAQERAIAPAAAGRRKVVLTTSIAETSLTIEGVRVVIDAGLARVPVYEPGTGLTRLETVKVSRAAADQRRGRAGRVEPGVCYRLWDQAATMGLEPYARPEILAADLSGLVLDLAAWGVSDPAQLLWLDPPSAPAWQEAKALLVALQALDHEGRLTPRGKRLREWPLPPRLAAMVMDAGAEDMAPLAAEIAVLLVERGLGGKAVDLHERLENFRHDRSPRAEEARALARRWAQMAGAPFSRQDIAEAGLILAHAYPDRVAQARGALGQFRLANGRGAGLDATDTLSRAPFLAVAELSGAAASARIMLAARLSEEDIETAFAACIETRDEVAFDSESCSLRARRVRRLDALVLREAPLPVPPGDEAARALAEGLMQHAFARLPWSKPLQQWRARIAFLRAIECKSTPSFSLDARSDAKPLHTFADLACGDPWPDLSDEALISTAADWLTPMLGGVTSLNQLGGDTFATALKSLLPYDLSRRLDHDAPTHFTTPAGSHLPIDYEGETPTLAVRVQELFGLAAHPVISSRRVPLTLELLSPAHRPVQVTRDLPGFWRGSYAAVRAEMRGRYPKHPWPEDPLTAVATSRVKPRG